MRRLKFGLVSGMSRAEAFRALTAAPSAIEKARRMGGWGSGAVTLGPLGGSGAGKRGAEIWPTETEGATNKAKGPGGGVVARASRRAMKEVCGLDEEDDEMEFIAGGRCLRFEDRGGEAGPEERRAQGEAGTGACMRARARKESGENPKWAGEGRSWKLGPSRC